MIQVSKVEKHFEEKRVLGPVSLKVNEGEIIYLLGQSGSGKSTLMNILAGLEDADTGVVRINGEKITGPEHNLVPGYKNINHVSQDFKLDPFRTAAQFMARRIPYLSPTEKEKRIKRILRVCGLAKRADAKPHELSGGEQQRIALAASLINEPDVVLLDEPFSNLDIPLKRRLRFDILEILKSENVTAVVVSHDPYEALAAADKVMILRQGKLVQMTSPQDLYEKPRSIYVASFLGDINKVQLNGENILVRPAFFIPAPKGAYEGTVIQCIYQGENYHLKVATKISDQPILIFSDKPVSRDEKLRFNIKV